MKRSLVFCAISLHQMAGGLEKNIVLLANHFSDKDYDVQIITFDLPGSESFFQIRPSVIWRQVGVKLPHRSISFTDRMLVMKKIREIIQRKPNSILIVFHHGILLRYFLSTIFLKKSVICSERNSLSLYKHVRLSKWNLNFLMLSWVDKITVQFDQYIEDYPYFFKNKIVSISNPIFPSPQFSHPSTPSSSRKYILLHVGRLCTQKQQDLLIDSFTKLIPEFNDWELHILGDGEHYEKLQKKIEQSCTAQHVFLHGKVSDVSTWMEKSHIFCLPSQWEGFPNALAEAMAHGLPCVGFANCAGVRDLIEDGVTGRLVVGENCAESLAIALRELMANTELRKQFGQNALEFTKSFSPQRIFRQWEDLFLAQ